MNTAIRHQIAGDLLGSIDPSGGYCACPGAAKHTGRNGYRDCLVQLDGAPTIYCVHTSCGADVERVNALLRARIAAAESGGRPAGERRVNDVVDAPKPVKAAKYPPYSPEALETLAGRCQRPVSLDWLAARSPVPLRAPGGQGRETSLLFLASLYEPGERALVFTRFYSQGDFIFEAEGALGWRLSEDSATAPVRSGLPADGPEGVWFLTNPVTGEWVIQPGGGAGGPAKWGRRHGGCVTAWRYLLLESDEAPEDLWLKALAMLPLAIVAIFTSGGRSVHALVRADCASKADLDGVRDVLRRVCGPLGADCAALSAVRLARLPGCYRNGARDGDGKWQPYPAPRLQRLVWLNPDAVETPICDIAK
jgi:hypothetical protein